MQWDDMPDFDINKLTAEALGLITDGGAVAGEGVSAGLTGAGDLAIVDYCNDPADAWPVIVGNSIGINPSHSDHLDLAWIADNFCDIQGLDGAICHSDKKPLRAAMVVFLRMRMRAPAE